MAKMQEEEDMQLQEEVDIIWKETIQKIREMEAIDKFMLQAKPIHTTFSHTVKPFRAFETEYYIMCDASGAET
jgi:hypothetical protein